MYSKYASNIAIRNGPSTLNNPESHDDTPVKLSNILYITISATAKMNQ